MVRAFGLFLDSVTQVEIKRAIAQQNATAQNLSGSVCIKATEEVAGNVCRKRHRTQQPIFRTFFFQ